MPHRHEAVSRHGRKAICATVFIEDGTTLGLGELFAAKGGIEGRGNTVTVDGGYAYDPLADDTEDDTANEGA